MVKKSVIVISVILVFISSFAYAKEAGEIENMLPKARNLGVIVDHKSFKVCLNSRNAEALFKFKVEKGGNYKMYSTSYKVDAEGKLLSRNFSYQLVVDCTDFNIRNQKRVFNCEEELRSSKVYYLYFVPTGGNPSLGCINIKIVKE